MIHLENFKPSPGGNCKYPSTFLKFKFHYIFAKRYNWVFSIIFSTIEANINSINAAVTDKNPIVQL